MPLEPELCADHVRVGGGVPLSPDGLMWRADPILAAATWAFRLAGQCLAAAASKKHHFGHKIVFCFVFCFMSRYPNELVRVH